MENNNLREKEIYDFTIKSVEIKLERKHHLETKSLAILQASAVLITLFVGFQSSIAALKDNQLLYNYIFFRNGFYISILISLISLLLSLFDALTGKFKDFQEPYNLYFAKPLNQSLQEYYNDQLNHLIETINSINSIIERKAHLFNIGISFFVFSICFLLIIGFIFY